jgi:hypothetical protein
MRLLRGWMRDTIRTDKYMRRYGGTSQPIEAVPETSDDEVVAAITEWRNLTFDQYRVETTADFFWRWLTHREAQIRRVRAKTAAAKRWVKRKNESRGLTLKN